MNNQTHSVDPEVAATLRALRRASDRALRLAKATGTPFWVVKDGQIVNLNPNAKGGRKVRPTARKGRNTSEEPEARAGKARKGSGR